MRCTRLAAAAGLLCAWLPLHAQEQTDSAQEQTNPAAVLEAPSVEVVGTTPLPGIGTPVNQVPTNVQTITGQTIQEQQNVSLPEAMDKNLGSVSVTNGQANPFMPDVSFRGFQGSPLLGVPQGISVFVDGVRVNSSFGDTVNWDLIQDDSVSTINLIPGSNPVFGLNTLGGALAINTKSGKTYPGGSLTLQGGSFGSYEGTADYGGHSGPWDYFAAGTYLHSDGWRDYSSSRIEQIFGKAGYETGDFDADLSYTFANNSLQGTQTSPLSMLDVNPAMAYTYPDITNNLLNGLNLRLSKVLSADKILGGNVYYRGFSQNTFSSNVNADCADAANGYCTPASGNAQGTNDTSDTSTDAFGGTLQFTLLAPISGHENTLIAGVSYDGGRTQFTQYTQAANFSSNRGTIGVSPFALDTNIDANNNYYGVYLTDTFGINRITFLTVSARYNYAQTQTTDNTGTEPGLNGDNTFSRVTPAIGLNWNPTRAFNTFISYNEGMRVPTPAELTCADPNAPCKLPNAFLADPPLEPVIAKTFELGTQGAITKWLSYNATAYRTNLYNDIEFVSASSTGAAGYFQNVGTTRRQGLELGMQGSWRKLTAQFAYSYINATFQTPFTVSSPDNSSANAAGDIQVQSGDTIPGIPKNNFKLLLNYAFTPQVNAGLSVVYAGSQYAQGDQNNQDSNGQIPGYTVVNLTGSWQVTEDLQLFGRVDNLFDTTYALGGVLGENFFTGPGFTFDGAAARAEQFRTPGAPISFYVGLRYQFGRKGKPASTRDD
jgi:iron complex outermembrane receptor protein